MKNLHVFFLGTAYGLLMRLIFGQPIFSSLSNGFASGPMLMSFVLFVPAALGVFTLYAARARQPGFGFALFGPWVPTLCFVAGTALLLIEGSICIVLALPIFLFCASLGGLVGWLVIKLMPARPGAVNSVLLLPLLSGYFELQLPLPPEHQRAEESIHIAASPQAIWQLINHAVDIKPEEMSRGLAYRIGVPLPLEAITEQTPSGRVRKLRWDKQVRFDEPITDWEENRYIRWTYDFKPDAFPPGALDEHVLIGGRYFDLNDTSYRLTPEADGTRLDIVVNYRVSTNFNFYAAWWGKVMVENSAATILNFYKVRAEQKQG